jgi:hypothetical protein
MLEVAWKNDNDITLWGEGLLIDRNGNAGK